MSEIQVLPLPRVDSRYGPTGGKYPERIRVAMSDGTSHWYRIEIQQPAPILKDALEHFDMVVGYEKPADATNIQPAAQKRITRYYSTEKER